MLLIITVGLLLLAGCGKTMLYKDGMTQQSFKADLFDCEQKVVTMYGGYAQMGPGHAIYARNDIKRCMEAKDYHEATEDDKAHATAAKARPPDNLNSPYDKPQR